MHPSSPQAPGGPPVPERLGGFTIVGLLGSGGSGVVYSARWGHREVALKVLHPALVATDKERARFFAEAQLLAGITHPSVVKVLNVGSLPDGRPYLAMELLRGETLAARLARGPLPVPAALEVFYQIASAVDALHTRGLVHRDLKPENVMLVGDGPFAILLDFGIAKELEAPDSTVTQDGGVRGTPAYMAPERFFGQSASASTDIYEIGVLLYAMLTARLPWGDCADPEARLNPQPPSVYGIALPGTLEVDLLRALSTRAANRPASIRELWARVHAQSSGVPATPQRRTADVEASGPRVTAPIDTPVMVPATAPTPAAYAPAYAPAPPAATPAPAFAPSIASPAAYHAPPMSQHATTASLGAPAPAPRRRWPWIVLGAVGMLAVLLVIGILVGGDDDEARATETAASETATPAEPSTAKRADDRGARPSRTEPNGFEAELAALLNESASTSRPSAPALSAESLAAFSRSLSAHPRDTALLIGIQVGALANSDSFHRMLAESGDRGAGLDPVVELVELCDLDFRSEVEWITAGLTPYAADDLDFDLVVSGAWTRTRIHECLGRAAADARNGVRFAHTDRITSITKSGATLHVGWIDERTLVFSTRDEADPVWLAARLDGRDPVTTGTGPAASMLDRAEREATVWFAGDGYLLLDQPLMNGAPRESALFGDIADDRELAFHLGFRYATDADAATAMSIAETELAELTEDDPAMAALMGEFAADRSGRVVVVHGHLTAFATSLLGGAIMDIFLSAP